MHSLCDKTFLFSGALPPPVSQYSFTLDAIIVVTVEDKECMGKHCRGTRYTN